MDSQLTTELFGINLFNDPVDSLGRKAYIRRKKGLVFTFLDKYEQQKHIRHGKYPVPGFIKKAYMEFEKFILPEIREKYGITLHSFMLNAMGTDGYYSLTPEERADYFFSDGEFQRYSRKNKNSNS